MKTIFEGRFVRLDDLSSELLSRKITQISHFYIFATKAILHVIKIIDKFTRTNLGNKLFFETFSYILHKVGPPSPETMLMSTSVIMATIAVSVATTL